MGRKTKRTAETQAKLVQAIEVGATYELAANFAGIHRDTLSEWRKSDSDFADAVRAAEGRAAVKWLALIDRAASDGDWHAAAWKLERRYPRSYGRLVQEQEHTGVQTITIRRVDDWREYSAATAARRAAGDDQ